MDIFQLLEIDTIKELKKYLKNYAIQYKRSFHDLIFKAEYFNVSCTVHINVFRRRIGSRCIVMDNVGYTYQQRVDNILKIKDELIPILGKPKLDNTNHLNRDYISIHFENDHSYISLVCHRDDAQKYAAIVLCKKQENAKNKKLSMSPNLYLWISSLIGGLIWGLIMFASMGAGSGYTLENFSIWMCGGVVFGVAFAFIFGLSNRISNNKPKFPKKKIEKIIQVFSLEKEKDFVSGNLFIYKSPTSHLVKHYAVPALMMMTDEDIIIYSIVKGKQMCLKKPLKEAFLQMQTSSIEFKKEDVTYIFAFRDSESFDQMENNLFYKLIQPEAFSSLFSDLKKATIEYNPYSIYDTNSDEILDEAIRIIAKILFVNDDIKKLDLSRIINEIFEQDAYCAEALAEVYLDVYAKFIMNGNKDG